MKKPTSLLGLTSLCLTDILGRPQVPEIDFKNFPITIFDEPPPTEPRARMTREAKSKKFNSHAKAISESSAQIFTNSCLRASIEGPLTSA